MTDHDQTVLELYREHEKTRTLMQLVIALITLLAIALASSGIQAWARGRDFAALSAKCGEVAK